MTEMEHTANKPHCLTCGAQWSEDLWSKGCEECGGGALKRPCPACEGRCGETWRRAVMDSNDSRVGHWVGRCAEL
jgi:hypothetical protein